MNVLVLGGTRLLGLSLVSKLLSSGHRVTVISRRPEKCPHNTHCIGSDKITGLQKIKSSKFDITFDFLAYNAKDVHQVFNLVDPGKYILISSTWLVKLNSISSANSEITTIDPKCKESLLEITYNYLSGKMNAEAAVLEMRAKNKTASIIRFPIFWGHNDHTGRVAFYLERINDGHPVICVNGGENHAQILWVEDAARAMIKLIRNISLTPIWEALPDNGRRVIDIIKLMTRCAEKKINIIKISDNELKQFLPDYLIEEPLWREKAINISTSNIFAFTKISPTPLEEWLCKLSKKKLISNTSILRNKEIILIEKYLR